VRLAALLAVALLSAPAFAIDPTAPPRAAAASSATGTDPAASTQLAWVRVDGPRSVAWYGGTVARLGDTVNGERLLAVREDHVVLSGAQGTRRVYLLDPRLRAQQSTSARGTVRR
jgi:hypothetical protein